MALSLASENPTTGATATRLMRPFGTPRGGAVTWPSDRGYLNAPVDPFTAVTHVGARDYLAWVISTDTVRSQRVMLIPRVSSAYTRR